MKGKNDFSNSDNHRGLECLDYKARRPLDVQHLGELYKDQLAYQKMNPELTRVRRCWSRLCGAFTSLATYALVFFASRKYATNLLCAAHALNSQRD